MRKTYETWQEAAIDEYNKYTEYLGKICVGRYFFEPNLTVLTDRQITIFKLRYVDGLTLAAVGKRLGISGSRVRQIIEKALDHMDVPSGYRRR